MSIKGINKYLADKKEIKIIFIGEINNSIGSDRIFVTYFNSNLNKVKNIQSSIRRDTSSNLDCDIIIFKKGYCSKEISKAYLENKGILVGIINPSNKDMVSIKNADFAIVGSVEVKAYYSRYLKCFIYPLIEEVPEDYIVEYAKRPQKVICYHGNKIHLDLIDINIEKALNRLISEGYEFKAIYNHEELGKCNKKFITNHVQWDKNTWLREIANSSVGICPASHYSGFIRSKLASLITSRGSKYNDLIFKYKNNMNAGRSFVFHQLKIPVIAEIGGSHHHIMGDEIAGSLCYSEKSWYEAISNACSNELISAQSTEKAFTLMKELYNPINWCERFIRDIKNWRRDN